MNIFSVYVNIILNPVHKLYIILLTLQFICTIIGNISCATTVTVKTR